MRARRRTAILAAGGLTALALLSGPAASAATWTQTYSGDTSRAPLISAVLTPDGSATSVITKAGGTVTMAAPATSTPLSNLRKVFWPAGLTARTDEQTCATWAAQSDDREQEGLALRITDISGDVRAITVTKNVIYGVWWDANVHVWDSQAAQPFTGIAQFDTSAITITGGTTETPFPWRACARVQGSVLTFKLWMPAQGPEPSWTDPSHTWTATIPAGYLGAGQAGWYAGHIPAGGVLEYTRLGLWAS